MELPPNFSPDQWQRLSNDQKLHFWEGYTAALRRAIDHVRPDELETVTAELAAAEEARNALRP